MKEINITKLTYRDDNGKDVDITKAVGKAYIMRQSENKTAQEAASRAIMDRN